jgi:hypothetical protein
MTLRVKKCPHCGADLPENFIFYDDGQLYTCGCGTQMFWEPVTGLYGDPNILRWRKE